LVAKNLGAGGEAPLKGIKIANFAWVGVGPQGAKYLSCWGATTVRVESHRRPDMARLMLPFKDNIARVDNQPWFADINGSAYGISIDLNEPSGLDIAWRLVKWADIFVESFRPGTMKRWGLDYEGVSKVRPDIIYMSTSQTGGTGPLAKFAGFGVHAAAMAGFTHLTGWPDRNPTPVPMAFSDPLAARFVGIAILSALEYRRRTGKGQRLEVSQWEASLQHLAPVIMDYLVNGRTMIRSGNSLPYAAPHNVYPCKGDDRWCAIAVLDDAQWKAFCKVVAPEWTKDPRFSSLLSRKKNEAELDELVSKWTKNLTAEDVEATMQAAGVPCHLVSNVKDFLNDPQIKHRDFLPKLKHSVMGYHTYHKHGFTLSKTEGTWRAAPALGEHNEYVFKELLGMTDDEIADALIAGGITTDADLPEVRAVI
jgi:benzylsuccinate CoA-transferase BbsF subunit